MPNPENIEPYKMKPGETLNPYGRPRGSKNLSTILREMLDEEVEVTIDGKKEKRTFQDVIIRKLIKKANDGDMRAIQEIFDRTEGKATQSIDQKTEHSGEIAVRWQEPNVQHTEDKGSS